MPDYNSGETIINKSKNATYTIKSNGWINYKIQAGWDPVSVMVNNVSVGTSQITTDNYFVNLTGIAPVKKGDVVKIVTASKRDDVWVIVWFLSNR